MDRQHEQHLRREQHIVRHDHSWVEHNHPERPEFTIHLLWAELEFDIKYGVIKRAKFAGIEGKPAKNYKFTKSDEDWLLRAVDNAVHTAKSKLGWACQKASRFQTDELLDTPLEYNFVFRFDGMKWLGSAQDLMSLVHQYVTNTCIAEFVEMTGSNEYAVLQEKADEAIRKAWEEVNHCILDDAPKFIL